MTRARRGEAARFALGRGYYSAFTFSHPPNCDTPLAHGVKIAPGSIFSNSDRFDGYIRLACPRIFDVSDAAHEAVFDTLGRLVREAMAAA
ncbi:hypothetical protein [Burkholderia cenocepacia]|uniref:hypothetical protein n=1 Tax=Burkholderia cenocepacia TaxID=95486 RepID=UPI0039F09DE1